MDFFQSPPVFGNPYLDDKIFRNYLLRIIPEGFYSEIHEDLQRFAERVVHEMEPLARRSETYLPVHVPYDPWGKRIDEIRVCREWERLHEIAAEEGIVATGYERKYSEFSRVYQFSKLYLYHPSSAIYSCPLAMTDGAARLIELFGTPDMKKRAYKFLTSRDPKTFWTSGQWMTEKSGGSDLSGSSTIAKKEGDQYRLHGVKWFTSATTSQMAMTLARIDGEEKLSLFYLELRDQEGNLQNIQINRLKDKMGTKALPTAELTLNGTPAILVGERGKGVKTISTLFNITRLYNACCAVGYMRRGLALSLDYSKKRIAFGKPILNHGLHAEVLAGLLVRFEASFLMAFHSALLLGKEETGKANEVEKGTLRLLIPLVKLFTAKEGVTISSEVIESFGGAGYVEDTGLPQLFRNAQVLSIWEGTTNVLSLDSLRAIKKENAAEYFMKDLELRLERIEKPELLQLKDQVKEAMARAISYLKNEFDEEQMNSEARTLAMNLSRTYCASLLLEHAEWELDQKKGNRGVVVAGRFIGAGLYEDFKADKLHREDSLSILS